MDIQQQDYELLPLIDYYNRGQNFLFQLTVNDIANLVLRQGLLPIDSLRSHLLFGSGNCIVQLFVDTAIFAYYCLRDRTQHFDFLLSGNYLLDFQVLAILGKRCINPRQRTGAIDFDRTGDTLNCIADPSRQCGDSTLICHYRDYDFRSDLRHNGDNYTANFCLTLQGTGPHAGTFH